MVTTTDNNSTDGSGVRPVQIVSEMRSSYLDYAMSVIVARALPDARDGLKPVQRRILFAMQELGINPNTPFKKCARMVGDVMGKYHPHGDSAIYEALVRMAQPFSMRYPLITGQGNFGSVDGDPPAAMRYTEARLAPISSELLSDLDRNTVNMVPNFDDSLTQPEVLPARLPNLLLNGASGIAVGMATNIPPHNINELTLAIDYLITNPEATVDELMVLLRGPDFPTAGTIFDRTEIRQAYATGRGRLVMHARIALEETSSGRSQIIVTELPYQVNKAALLERIAEQVRSKVIEGITDLRDESDRNGMRMVIELGRNASYHAVRSQLLKHSALQSVFHVNLVALVTTEDTRPLDIEFVEDEAVFDSEWIEDRGKNRSPSDVTGRPETLSLRESLQAFIDHRRQVVQRRSVFDRHKARQRRHILAGLLKAIENLDEIIDTIRSAESAEVAKASLMDSPHNLTDRQAQAVLDLQLRRLAHLESSKIIQEYDELVTFINELNELLGSQEKIDDVLKADNAELREKYGDERRTQIVESPVDDISAADLIPHQQVVVTMSETNYVKRVPLETYRTQHRGGKGVAGQRLRDEDKIKLLLSCDTHDRLLIFAASGRVFALPAHEINDSSRTAQGVHIRNLVEFGEDHDGDQVTAVIAIKDQDQSNDDQAAMIFATEKGEVKRTLRSRFDQVRRNGIIAMNLKPDDRLVSVSPAAIDSTAILVSSDGYAVRFELGKLREASRTSGGVKGIKLNPGARLVGLVIDSEGDDILVMSNEGKGKRTPISDYPVKGRGTRGVRTFGSTNDVDLIGAAAVREDDQLMIITKNGQMLRTRAGDVRQSSRATKGVMTQKPTAGDSLAAFAIDLADREQEI
jgi:DNA gyrase subunit A